MVTTPCPPVDGVDRVDSKKHSHYRVGEIIFLGKHKVLSFSVVNFFFR